MSWIRTHSRRRVELDRIRAEDICLEDVAHALSQICRFTGHTSRFYSVAEHCVHVSLLVEPEHARWGLLHDAPEAYIGDVSRPLKRHPGMQGYRHLETKVESAVLDAFHVRLNPTLDADVKAADLQMLCVEARDLLGIDDFPAAGWEYWVEPRADVEVHGWYPEMAKACFMARCAELGIS